MSYQEISGRRSLIQIQTFKGENEEVKNLFKQLAKKNLKTRWTGPFLLQGPVEQQLRGSRLVWQTCCSVLGSGWGALAHPLRTYMYS